jgi:hypothetical protein
LRLANARCNDKDESDRVRIQGASFSAFPHNLDWEETLRF